MLDEYDDLEFTYDGYYNPDDLSDCDYDDLEFTYKGYYSSEDLSDYDDDILP